MRAWEPLPKRALFAPLLADPRSPHLAVGRRRHQDKGSGLGSTAFVDVGEYFPLMGDAFWQFGVQAGVFTLWDMGTESDDFVNADFLVGLPYTWRRGLWSGMARLYHDSTHLGDEFLLNNPVKRLNLSYEAFDLRLSYDWDRALRFYGGGGYIWRRFPSEMKPGLLQAGAEYLHGRAYLKDLLRPVAAMDLKKHEEGGWARTDLSLRLGVQLANRHDPGRRLMVLFEYFRGRDPNGQFYIRSVEYLGAGLHVYF